MPFPAAGVGWKDRCKIKREKKLGKVEKILTKMFNYVNI